MLHKFKPVDISLMHKIHRIGSGITIRQQNANSVQSLAKLSKQPNTAKLGV